MAGVTDIIIAKHRNGAVCDVSMRFRSSEVKFVDISEPDLSREHQAGSVHTYGSKLNSNTEFIPNSDFDS